MKENNRKTIQINLLTIICFSLVFFTGVYFGHNQGYMTRAVDDFVKEPKQIKFDCVKVDYYNNASRLYEKDFGCFQKTEGGVYWHCQIMRCTSCPETPMLINGLKQVVCLNEEGDGLGGDGSGCYVCPMPEEV